MGKIKKNIRQMSLLKTIKFNYHYFGFKSIFKPRAVIAKNVKFGLLRGIIECPNNIGSIMIGFAKDRAYPIKKCKTYFSNEGKLCIKEHFSIAYGASFYMSSSSESNIYNLSVGQGTMIKLYSGIEVGKNVIVSWDCQIIDDDSHLILDANTKKILNKSQKIKLGNNVWVCSKCIILKGTNINNDVVIAAGSFVSKRIENDNVIISNNKIIKSDIFWGNDMDYSE